ncbi:MAG: type II toxin-antitoxin system Phd/YefM family antitoxin [Thermomonas sp.]|uniref:type II toxin-antitoxin system Phd/YefM family antitoxin n=1 Tax=Thermomonas sp. TaxID=1971895 RepID=UPI001D3D974A|nr:type II toxin-antitoxin system Phd/YefM family antitoxin [Thermomonas sp.]MBZ0087773.1 type II toxin-antitoxin system Phd/YefM family antitoxin [Thermomonas sp.]
MNAATTPTPASALPQTPASDVKKLGWRGVMKLVAKNGKVLVTNHKQPEAVILPVEEYNRILQLLIDAGEKDRAVVEQLRRKYDERLQWLDEPGAGDMLDSLFYKPLDLGGKIFTGDEF